MSKMWLKSCPRCRGDLYEEAAVGLHRVASHYISCLQCGHVLTEAEESRLLQLRQTSAPAAVSRVA